MFVKRRWVVLLVGCGALALLAPAIVQADSVVQDVSNTLTRPEGEESLAVNPINTNNILVGANQIPSQEVTSFPNPSEANAPCGLWVSHDGGATWSVVNLPGFGQGADQSVVFDRHGTAYYACDQLLGIGGVGGIVVWRSADGGDHWTGPVTAAATLDSDGHLIDRPFLAVDTSGGPRDGTVYVGWESFFTEPISAVYLRSSTDGGQHWGAVTRPDGADFPSMIDPRQYPAVDANGTVYVEYVAGLGNSPALPPVSPMSIVVARSHDGGATFQRTAVDGHVVRGGSPQEATAFFLETIAAIATDPRRPGHVAVAWPDARSGESRIVLSDSVDGGVTWTVPLDIADDPAGHGNQHDHVAIAYAPDGRIGAIWRDHRDSGGGFTTPFGIFARMVSVGSAGELTPGTAVRMSTSPQPTANCIPCEYFAAAAGPDGLSAAWEEMRGANADAVFRRLPLSALGTQATMATPVIAAGQPLPDTSAGPGQAALGTLGIALLLLASVLALLRPRRRGKTPA